MMTLDNFNKLYDDVAKDTLTSINDYLDFTKSKVEIDDNYDFDDEEWDGAYAYNSILEGNAIIGINKQNIYDLARHQPNTEEMLKLSIRQAIYRESGHALINYFENDIDAINEKIEADKDVDLDVQTQSIYDVYKNHMNLFDGTYYEYDVVDEFASFMTGEVENSELHNLVTSYISAIGK